MLKLKEKPIKKPSDRILIQGIVTVWQGEGKDKKIIFEKKENHWVDGGLKGITTLLGANGYDGRAWHYAWHLYLGSNTITATTHGMTALTNPIGTAPGTAPSSQSGTNMSNPATGQWEYSVTAIWYSGTISGTVGEMAYYAKAHAVWNPGGFVSEAAPTEKMLSRLSAADGDFTSFAVDTTKSLTVQWKVRATFA